MGFLYLVAIIDWYSRYVLSWRLSNTLDVGFCVEAAEEALRNGNPDIFNAEQGARFTSEAFTGSWNIMESGSAWMARAAIPTCRDSSRGCGGA